MRRRVLLLLAIVVAGVAVGAGGWAAFGGRSGLDRAAPLFRKPGVVFVIMDTVRQDHLSLCGYDRPTSPTLERLARAGAAYTCRAYAPGSWTLPSHASFFTGKDPVEHGAHELVERVEDPSGTKLPTAPLGKELPTLAEQMRDRGFQTVLVAANPVVGKGSGLSRGFDHARTAKGFHDFDEDDQIEIVKKMMRKLKPWGGPLFLTVNLVEAHQRWAKVPAKIPWLRPQRELFWRNEQPANPWYRWFRGLYTDAEKAEFLAGLRDSYDWGVYREDRTLGKLLKVLRASGWCGDDCRVVITSDHGEFLGEHGLIDHGFYVWEPNSRVHLMVVNGPDRLPEPISAVHAFHLVRDGALPDELAPIRTPAWTHVRRYVHSGGTAFGSVSSALWEGTTKQVKMDGRAWTFDLATDPREERPSAGVTPAFEAWADAAVRAGTPSGDPDEEMTAMLKAAGYLE
jgi:hypothetical protein